MRKWLVSRISLTLSVSLSPAESPYVLEELRSLGALRVLREELGRPPEENERLTELYDEAVARLQEAEEEHQRRHRRRKSEGEGARETEEEGLGGEA